MPPSGFERCSKTFHVFGTSLTRFARIPYGAVGKKYISGASFALFFFLLKDVRKAIMDGLRKNLGR